MKLIETADSKRTSFNQPTDLKASNEGLLHSTPKVHLTDRQLERMHVRDQFLVRVEDANLSISPHQFSFVFQVLMNAINGPEATQYQQRQSDVEALLRNISENDDRIQRNVSGKLDQLIFSDGNTIHGRNIAASVTGIEANVSGGTIISTEVPDFLHREGYAT